MYSIVVHRVVLVHSTLIQCSVYFHSWCSIYGFYISSWRICAIWIVSKHNIYQHALYVPKQLAKSILVILQITQFTRSLNTVTLSTEQPHERLLYSNLPFPITWIYALRLWNSPKDNNMCLSTFRTVLINLIRFFPSLDIHALNKKTQERTVSTFTLGRLNNTNSRD